MSVTNAILLHSLLIFLLLGSVLGVLAGAALILRPEWLRQVGKITNRWISTRRLDRSLETSINLDPWLYRYRRASGILILAGAGFIIYFFTVSFNKLGTLATLFKNSVVPPPLMDALLDALVLSMLVGAVLSLIVSLFLLFRPSLLRGFEQGANQSTSLRRALKPLEVSRANVDEYVFRHGLWVGVLLLLGSLYVLVGLAAWLK